MLVYWESMEWSIIANGVAYAKYKNVYKMKLIVLNGRLFSPRSVQPLFLCTWGR